MPIANKTKAARPETAPRVLLYDIETGPNLAYCWGAYEQNVIDFARERDILCFAWKWLGEKETHALALPMLPSYRKGGDNKRAHKALAQGLHALFCEADVVVGHNVQNFDDKMANTEFIINGLPPPPPHRVVDTLQIARSKFRFNSNKLDDLGKRLGLGRKVKHRGFNMWLGCLEGDKKSWAEMVKYCVGDIALLEKVFLKFRPWVKMPNLNERTLGCPTCGKGPMQRRGWRRQVGVRLQRFQCFGCGAWAAGSTIKGVFQFR